MSNLQILSNSIRTFENLFSLNDLHQASGNLAKHKPVLFLRLDTTKELIAEIESETPNVHAVKTIRGTQGGTYVCEELVLSYAMWISPKFHLVVLRAFMAMHKQPQQLALPEPTYDLSLTAHEMTNLLNAWFHFTVLGDCVLQLVQQTKPFLHGNIIAQPEYQLRACHRALSNTRAIMEKVNELLPNEKHTHFNRAKFANLDF